MYVTIPLHYALKWYQQYNVSYLKGGNSKRQKKKKTLFFCCFRSLVSTKHETQTVISLVPAILDRVTSFLHRFVSSIQTKIVRTQTFCIGNFSPVDFGP